MIIKMTDILSALHIPTNFKKQGLFTQATFYNGYWNELSDFTIVINDVPDFQLN